MTIHTCPNCGKAFLVYGQWGYAYDGKYTCSYKCMRAMRSADMNGEEINMPLKKGQTPRRLTEDEKQQIRKLRESGLTYREIAEKVGGGVIEKTVSAYCARENIVPAAEKAQPAAAPQPAAEPKQNEIRMKILTAPEGRIDRARVVNTLLDIAQLLILLWKTPDENGL